MILDKLGTLKPQIKYSGFAENEVYFNYRLQNGKL